MKILLEPRVALALETAVTQTRGMEFSGFGFVKVSEDTLSVYDYVLLHVGSAGFTSIPAKTMLELIDRPDAADMKLWFHRHPVGNGIPGPHNWSGTDHDTCINTPLGGIPQLVKWSAAIVRTPRGWVGRLDNHIRHTTLHVPVEPNVDDIFTIVDDLNAKKLARQISVEREALRREKPRSWFPKRARQLELPVTLAEAYGHLDFEDLEFLDADDIELLEGLDEDAWFVDRAEDYGDFIPRSQHSKPKKSIHSKVQSFFRRGR